jgi:hypothetical protein
MPRQQLRTRAKVNCQVRNDLFEDIYQIVNTFGHEKIDEILFLLGKPFIDYCIENKKCKTEKLFEVSHIVTNYGNLFEKSLDPMVVGISVIGKIRELFI